MAQPKYNWYETDQEVVLSVLVKNLQENNVKVDFSERKLNFYGKNSADEEFSLELRLKDEVIVEQCSYRVGTVKVEIHLKKKTNYRWLKLEFDEKDTNTIPVALNTVPTSNEAGDLIKRHQDKIRLIEQQIKAVEEEEAKNEGVNELFKQIYSSSNEEVRKAMNKSFVESNGTVLSTNWNEVKAKPVEMKPPDGVEFKKFDL